MKRLLGLCLAALLLVRPCAALEAHRPSGVTICMPLEPPILDPSLGAGQAIREVVYANIFEGLVGVDRDGKLVPRLAQSWAASDNGLQYDFILRQGVTFHDGAPFTSADVKFSFERAMATTSKNVEKWIFEPIKAIETPDEHRVRILLKYPAGLFLYGLGWADAAVFSENSLRDNATHPVGTGPYKFEDWIRGDRITLVRNPSWWGGKPPMATAVFRFINDPQALVTAIEAGDCDLLPAGVAPETIARLQKNEMLTVTIGQTEGETILAINNARPPFTDIRVRQALTQAIDRKAVIDGAMSGLATPIGSHFSPNHPAYVDLTGYAPYDPVKAKTLLAEAGYKQGFSTTISMPPLVYARRSAEIIMQMLEAVGIRVTLVPLEFPQWLERVYTHKDYDLSIIAHTEPLDIRIYARSDYYFQYHSRAFDALMQKINLTRSETERNALYREAQKLLAQDAVNVFLFELPKITVTRKGLAGAWVNWPIPVNPISELSWQ